MKKKKANLDKRSFQKWKRETWLLQMMKLPFELLHSHCELLPSNCQLFRDPSSSFSKTIRERIINRIWFVWMRMRRRMMMRLRCWWCWRLRRGWQRRRRGRTRGTGRCGNRRRRGRGRGWDGRNRSRRRVGRRRRWGQAGGGRGRWWFDHNRMNTLDDLSEMQTEDQAERIKNKKNNQTHETRETRTQRKDKWRNDANAERSPNWSIKLHNQQYIYRWMRRRWEKQSRLGRDGFVSSLHPFIIQETSKNACILM